jgi:hypothetical protein
MGQHGEARHLTLNYTVNNVGNEVEKRKFLTLPGLEI